MNDLMKKLKEAGSVGLDLSPGDPLCLAAYEKLKQGLTEAITITKVMKENEQLRIALKPFSDAVFNDNHEMTITPVSSNAYYDAYWLMRKIS